MNINRDNYEEFFLLYGDNELTGEDRIRVEQFVLENPDLQAEFSMLNQARFMVDDEISFEDKSSLLRTEDKPLTANEELILLSIDGELTPARQTEFDALLQRDGSLRNELALYRKTQLDPSERIVFPYKESLYRREQKTRVVSMAWKRFAAAAAILVAVSVTAFILLDNEDKQDSIASTGSTSVQSPANVTTADHSHTVDPNTGEASDHSLASEDHTNTEIADRSNAVPSTDVKQRDEVINVRDKRNEIASKGTTRDAQKTRSNVQSSIKDLPAPQDQVAKTHNDLPKPLYNPNVIANADQKDQLAVNTPPVKNTQAITSQKNPVVPVTQSTDDALHYTVNRMPEPGDETEDQGPSKSKLRGFFRKVTRTFEKNTNIKATDEEDRLLVGGLAIRL